MRFQNIINHIGKIMLGKSMSDSIIARESGISLKKYRRNRSRLRLIDKEFKERKLHLKNLSRICEKHISPVTCPLALISQIQRSGGSLLSQLLDGHPEIHAHPYELMIGFPKKYWWPKIDLNDRKEHWFEILFEDKVIKHFNEGYKKGQKQKKTYPFIFLPSLQKKIFLKYLDSIESINLRDVYDAYMTSYFGAWLNNQNSTGEKKFVTGFTPMLALIEDNVESFFEVYPDGRLISILRDPKNWFPSAIRHFTKRFENINGAISHWEKSANAMLWNKAKYTNRVCIIRFEDLINNTELVMRYLAGFLNIKFNENLLIPTFNKNSISANTSFKVEKPGIMASTVERYKTLTHEELKIINDKTGALYQKILDEAATF